MSEWSGEAGAAVGAVRPAAASALALDADLQTVFARAVRDLARSSGCARVVAWIRGEGGRPLVIAARLEGSRLLQPDEAAYAAAARLAAPTDLGLPGVPEALRALAEQHGVSAAAPVPAGEGRTAAALLLGDAREPAGRVRPRTLARMGQAAERLAAPAAAAFAARRLARLDADVRRLDRLAALGGLVAEIVHEIRNPLVSVKTFLQLLPERMHEPEFRESFLQVASDELRRVERLLDVVLEHGRPPAAARREARAAPESTLESVARLVGFRAAERGVRVEVRCEPALPHAAISGDALRQVVLNLALNAVDATPPGGCVHLRAAAMVDAVEVAVEDEGPGLDPALRGRVFEPFFSTKDERPGGLGLSITRRIVEEAGGRIEVDDRQGGGSAFRVRLPAARG